MQHAWHLEKKYNKIVEPVIISSFSVWMRSAFAYMQKSNGKLQLPKYLEATYLKSDDDQYFIWLEEPFMQ